LILDAVTAEPDITLAELRDLLKRHGIRSASRRSGASSSAERSRLKKTARAAEQRRGDINAAREEWFEGQIDLDPERLIFIDETSANTKMARLYGRSPRGERCRAAVPHGHWKTTTFTVGLHSDGLIAKPKVFSCVSYGRRARIFDNHEWSRLGSRTESHKKSRSGNESAQPHPNQHNDEHAEARERNFEESPDQPGFGGQHDISPDMKSTSS
jgi:hypothetical protein